MSPPSVSHLALATVLAAGVAGAAWKARALSASGAVAAAVVGFCHFGLAGGRGAVALLVFFVTSSALSRVGKRRKDALAFEKGGERDAGQVLANGGVATLCAALLPASGGDPWLLAALLGALATANADTWATELGALARRPPVMLTTLRPAPTGASGAVSGPGTLAAFGGALLVGLTALLWRTEFGTAVWTAVAVAMLGGFAGALSDSLLGATVQVQYRCPECDKLTERHEHCGHPTEYTRGVRWLNNDAVNALATLVGAAVAAGLLLLLTRR